MPQQSMKRAHSSRKTTDSKGSFFQRSWHKGRVFVGLGGIIIALLVAISSFIILLGVTPLVPNRFVSLMLAGVNIAIVFFLLAVLSYELYPIIKAWRARGAASRLHVRMITVFSLAAALPALVVAVVAAVTLHIGLDRWFNTNTKQIVASSVNLANAYAYATLQSLQTASYTMAVQMDQPSLLLLNPTEYRRQMTLQATGRDLLGVFLLRRDGSVIMSSERGEEKRLPIPPQSWIEEATASHPVKFQPGAHDYFGVILKMNDIEDAWLYAVRATDPRVLDALRLTEMNTEHYRELEASRVPAQIAFAVLYFCLFLIMLLSAVWTAIAVADKLVRPIRLLISAAADVASGNMDVVVPVRSRDGDVGQLSKTFNYMVAQLKSQRHDLITASEQVDKRRRFSEAVLSGVTAAVISVDDEGYVSIINRSAEIMFGLNSKEIIGKKLSIINSEVSKVFEIVRSLEKKNHQEQITIINKMRSNTRSYVYNIQITMEETETESHSWVVTIDDISDLVEAQRSSAWADVARRIAHEIKNPLTPIQLAAERIRRRYGKIITEDREIFDQSINTIGRQVEDIGRMVDEFSSFARMPKPNMSLIDLREPVKEAIFLIEVARNDIQFEKQITNEELMGHFDSRLIMQLFGNIIKNASEAIDAVGKKDHYQGHILIRIRREEKNFIVEVLDNGRGLPKKERQKLLEPYMTMREKGTGLGLAIVRKIVEDHKGYLELLDAPDDFYQGQGAMIRVIFPFISGDSIGHIA